MGAAAFLERYRQDIAALPLQPGNGNTGTPSLGKAEQRVFTTLLPLTAAIRRRHPEMTTSELIAEVKHYCCDKIDTLLNATFPLSINN